MLYYEKYSSKNFTIVRRKNEENPNNPYIRSLFLSAFLRCIYALLKFPEDVSIKNKMMDKLSNIKYLRELAALVDTCISCDFNVISKFIEIIKYILLRPKSKRKEFDINKHKTTTGDENFYDENTQINQKYIANLIKKVIFKVENKLSLGNENDKILLINLCQCCNILCNSLNYVFPKTKMLKSNGEAIQVRKKYLLNNKVDDYINFSIINLFIRKIIEYMKEENNYFKEISNKENSDKSDNNNDDKYNEDVIKNNLNDSEDYELDIDLIDLRQIIKNSNEIQILTLINGLDNKEEENIKSNKFKIDDTLINLISFIPLFIGEYMAKASDEKVFDIFEKFTMSNIFNEINIRKSYLKEIIDMMNSSKKRKLISDEFQSNFMTRVNMIDFKERDSNWFLLFVFEDEMRLEKICGSSDEKNDLISLEKLKQENDVEDDLILEIKRNIKDIKNLNNTISYQSITRIFKFDIKNRIIIKKGKGLESEYKMLFFKKSYVQDLIIDYIKLYNTKVEIIDEIEIFKSIDGLEEESVKVELEKENIYNREILDQAIEIKNEREETQSDIENSNLIDINNSTPTPDQKLDNEIQEKLKEAEEIKNKLMKLNEEKDLKKLKNNTNDNVILYCNIPIKGYFDFFFNLFKSQKEIEEENTHRLTDNRILIVDKNNLYIYNEIPENFLNININVFGENFINKCEIIKEMKKCFEKYDTRDIKKLTNIDFRAMSVKLTIDSQNFDIHFFDDFSMLKLKTCLFNLRKDSIVKAENMQRLALLEKK